MPRYNTITVYYKYRYINHALTLAKIASAHLRRRISSNTQTKFGCGNAKSTQWGKNEVIKKLPRLDLDSLF